MDSSSSTPTPDPAPVPRFRHWGERGTALLAVIALLAATIYPEPALAAATLLPDSDVVVTFPYDVNLEQFALDSRGLVAPPTARHSVVPEQIPLIAGSIEVGHAFRVIATAYSSTPGQTDADPFTTASGVPVGPATIAANFLPFGTYIRFNGETYVVHDRMSSRYNNRAIIDIWQPTTTAARRFGVRLIEIEIISIPQPSPTPATSE